MGIENKDSIDWMLQKKSGEGVLVIVDELDWSDEKAHLVALQGKLHRYLDFIESGEVYQKFSASGATVVPGTKITIEIVGRFELPPAAQRFLERVRATLAASGLSLSFRHQA